MALINVGTDGLAIYEKHKIYEKQEDLNVKEIKSSLDNLKKAPSLDDLSEAQYSSWRRKQRIKGKFNEWTSYSEENILYQNQQFVRIYGEKYFRKLTLNQRRAIVEDSIAKWNGNHVNTIFNTYLYPYIISSAKDTVVDYNKLQYWNEFSEQPVSVKLTCLRGIVAEYEPTLDENFEDFLNTHLSWSVIFFTIFLGWGIFLLISKPMNYKLWKSITISILYIFITTALLFCTQQYLFVRMGAVGSVFILMVIILVLNFSDRGVRDSIISSGSSNKANMEIYTVNEKIYAGKVKNISSFSNTEQQLLEKIRMALQISPERAEEIEREVVPELTDSEKEYQETYLNCIGKKSKLTKSERHLLDCLRDSLGISKSRARYLENTDNQIQR